MENIKKRKLIDGRMAVLIGGQLIVVVLILFMLMSRTSNGNSDKLQNLRMVSIKLQEAGLIKEAIGSYEDYFFQLPSEKVEEGVKISYLVANLYKELGSNRQAIRWYYQTIESGLSTSEVEDSKKEVVVLLESLRKFGAAKSLLRSATKLIKDKEDQNSDVVVAKVDETKIFLHQINSAIDKFPKEIRNKFSNVKGKQQFISQLVGKELLYKRGERLGLDITAEVIENIKRIKKDLVINKVLEKEFKERVKLSALDIENYFKANISKYKSKGSKKNPKFSDVKERVKADYQMLKREEVYRGLVQELYKTSKVDLYLERVK